MRLPDAKSKRPRDNGPPALIWHLQRVLGGLLVTITLTAILSTHFLPPWVDLKVGEVSPRTISAPRTVTYVDTAATEALQERAAQAVPRQYYARLVLEEEHQQIAQVYQQIRQVTNDVLMPRPENRATRLEQELPLQLPRNLLLWAVTADPEVLQQLEQTTREIVQKIARREIRDDQPEDLQQARQEIAQLIAQSGLKGERARLVQEMASAVLRPNRIYDAEATKLARQQAREQVEPVQREVLAGETIIRRGDRVTQEHIDKLMALGFIRRRPDYLQAFFVGCLVALAVTFTCVYLYLQLPPVYNNGRLLVLLSLIAALALLLFQIHLPEFGSPVMLCAATVGLLVAILVDFHLAILLVGLVALLMGVALNNDARAAVEGFLSGLVAVCSLRKVVQRSHLVRAGFILASANVVIGAVTGALSNQPTWGVGNLLWWVGNGVGSFFLTISLIALLERPFRVTTQFRLLELANPNEPLLQQLLTEAPGTYHASLIIGNLAEAAAEAVGADPLLARAAAYYHDIGKMVRPGCFVENQFGGENIHERLKPMISALVLKSHVKDGVEIAREHGLPQPIIDVIEQHHGTSQISFFYQKALEQRREGEEIPEEQFRYEGPKPQFKEAGIIMLADTVEAAVRSMPKVTPQKITEVVGRLLRERLEDGQLDECDLTMRDLGTIRETFITILQGIFHSRIEYPERLERGNNHEAANKGTRERGDRETRNRRP
ncbi:MAG TPA: HDIG domain-containing protein [Armatimonadetes bacterium]|nr:HDIG domain-containing protein [Armatimonadota bacterium]